MILTAPVPCIITAEVRLQRLQAPVQQIGLLSVNLLVRLSKGRTLFLEKHCACDVPGSPLLRLIAPREHELGCTDRACQKKNSADGETEARRSSVAKARGIFPLVELP